MDRQECLSYSRLVATGKRLQPLERSPGGFPGERAVVGATRAF